MNFPTSRSVTFAARKYVRHYKSCLTKCTDCHVDDALHYTNLDQSAYEKSAPERGRLNLSAPIEIDTIAVNDGDGIILGVNSTSNNPLENAVYTRLNRVDVELYAVHYIRNAETNEVLDQFKGHWSLLGVQFFIDLFVPKGRATFCFQFPRDGRTEPMDHYKRPLKEFWFEFSESPPARELAILDVIIRNCASLRPEDTLVLKSPIDPRRATPERPFYLNLNALLVLSGHCHVFRRFCHDQHTNDMFALY